MWDSLPRVHNADQISAALRNLPKIHRMNQSTFRTVPSLSDSLAEFVACVGTHLSGDEKGEAADFLDHLFRTLGHGGIREAGATREFRLAKSTGEKGKNFADLLWPERVLVEMKSRGKKLERHYDQSRSPRPASRSRRRNTPPSSRTIAFVSQHRIDMPDRNDRLSIK